MRRARYQFGSVEKRERKSGYYWVYRYTDQQQVRRSIEIGTVAKFPKKAQAVKAAESLRFQANPDQPTARGVTLGGLLDRYILEEMPQRYSTSDSYGAWIRAYIRPKWGDYQLHDIKPFAVETWLKTLDLAPKSRGHIKTVMLSVFNCAMRWEFLALGINPMSLVRVPGVSKRQSKSLVLTMEQVQKLIAAVEGEPFKTACWMSVCLGLEPSVLFGLQWGDINFAESSLKIERGVVCGHVDRAKNTHREAPLPVDPRLIAMLQEWRNTTQFSKASDWVFASPYFAGEKPYHPRHFARLHLHPAAKACGLGDKIGWQTFRRTYSSLLRQMGVDLKIQSDLMRHADIGTTQNLYTDSFSTDMRDAHQNLVKAVMPRRVQ